MGTKCMTTLKQLLVLLIFFTTSGVIAQQRDNMNCGITQGMPLTNGYGPYDATLPENQSKLPIVLTAHFTKSVEQLVRGNTTIDPLPDIDYTLRAIPNYHAALNAVMNYELRGMGKPGSDLRYYTVDCYFKRALYLQPKDYKANLLYAIYLHRKKELKTARIYYENSIKIQPNFADAHYNYGLLLFAVNEYDASYKHAKIAYDAGMMVPGLKRKLVKKGYVFNE